MDIASKKSLTSRDIAAAAGVSQTTVSRVLQGSVLVQPDTRQAVQRVIDRLGYTPSHAARSMRTRRAGAVALVVANLSVNPLYPAFLQMLSAALRQRGLQASVWEAEHFDARTVEALTGSAVDGVIVATAMEEGVPGLKAIAGKKPVVLINRSVAGDDFDQIVSDNLKGGAAVASYLVEQGRRRIGLLSSHARPSPVRDRELGFVRGLKKHGIVLAVKRIGRVPHFSYETGFETARQLLARGRLDALFCVNDIVAIGALDGIRALGLRVPQDVWIVGYDDIPMASWACVDLTTMQQPMAAMVDAAVGRLCQRLEIDNDASARARLVLPSRLVLRGSTGSPATQEH